MQQQFRLSPEMIQTLRRGQLGHTTRQLHQFSEKVDFAKPTTAYIPSPEEDRLLEDLFEENKDYNRGFLWISSLYFMINEPWNFALLVESSDGGYAIQRKFPYCFYAVLTLLLLPELKGCLLQSAALVPGVEHDTFTPLGTYATCLACYLGNFLDIKKPYRIYPSLYLFGEFIEKANFLPVMLLDMEKEIGGHLKYDFFEPRQKYLMLGLVTNVICASVYLIQKNEGKPKEVALQKMKPYFKALFKYIVLPLCPTPSKCRENGHEHFRFDIVCSFLSILAPLTDLNIISEVSMYRICTAFYAEVLESFKDMPRDKDIFIHYLVKNLLHTNILIDLYSRKFDRFSTLARVVFWSQEFTEMVRHKPLQWAQYLFKNAAPLALSGTAVPQERECAVLFLRCPAAEILREAVEKKGEDNLCRRRFAMYDACECANFTDISKFKFDYNSSEGDIVKPVHGFPVHPTSECLRLNYTYYKMYTRPHFERTIRDYKHQYNTIHFLLCKKYRLPQNCFREIVYEYLSFDKICFFGLNVWDAQDFTMPYGDPELCINNSIRRSEEVISSFEVKATPRKRPIRSTSPLRSAATAASATASSRNRSPLRSLPWRSWGDRNQVETNLELYRGPITRSFAQKLEQQSKNKKKKKTMVI